MKAKLAIALILVLGLLLLPSLSERRRVHFETPEELKEFAVENELAFHSGGLHVNDNRNNFFIADHPLSFESLPHTRLDCGRTRAWRGIVWVTTNVGQASFLDANSIGGARRIWGNLLVAGDEKFMDHLEKLYLEKCP